MRIPRQDFDYLTHEDFDTIKKQLYTCSSHEDVDVRR